MDVRRRGIGERIVNVNFQKPNKQFWSAVELLEEFGRSPWTRANKAVKFST
jgi:hypothetical protein